MASWPSTPRLPSQSLRRQIGGLAFTQRERQVAGVDCKRFFHVGLDLPATHGLLVACRAES